MCPSYLRVQATDPLIRIPFVCTTSMHIVLSLHASNWTKYKYLHVLMEVKKPEYKYLHTIDSPSMSSDLQNRSVSIGIGELPTSHWPIFTHYLCAVTPELSGFSGSASTSSATCPTPQNQNCKVITLQTQTTSARAPSCQPPFLTLGTTRTRCCWPSSYEFIYRLRLS